MYKLLAILLEIDSFSPSTRMDKESSKSSFSKTVICLPNTIPFLSKNCKKSDEESFTPTQIPDSFFCRVDNKLLSIFLRFPSLSGIGSPCGS
jgi:hypothetical protein